MSEFLEEVARAKRAKGAKGAKMFFLVTALPLGPYFLAIVA